MPGERVLIAGGGVAAVEAVLALQELADRPLEITLLSPSHHFEYAPLSVAEPFDLGRAHRFELNEILRGRGVRTIVDALAGIDAERGEARPEGGASLPYTALLLAIGAARRGALPGAITFSGARASSDIRRLLGQAAQGSLRSLAFAVPAGVTWSLPAYELALLTSSHLAERGVGTRIAVVTPERRPVEAFGARAGAAVAEMLELRDIEFHTAIPLRAEAGQMILEGGGALSAEAVVALPRLMAPEIAGLPRGDGGFVPIDEHCRVRGLHGVYAAGDATDFPLKQGGIAAQQADAAAAAIAAALGTPLDPAPFRPVLRGLLLTGRAPRYLRAEVRSARAGGASGAGEEVWWQPAKIAGRRLGPFLALHGVQGGAPPDAVALELEASAAALG